MDVVYLTKPEEAQPELRYSLRSLQNLPHDRVWLAGYKPSWVSDAVGHIPTEQVPGEKHPNALLNWRAALESSGVSDPFILANDDHFVMRPVESMPVLNWGPLDHVVASFASKYTPFWDSMVETRNLLWGLGHEDSLSYQLHVPLIQRKAEMLDVMTRFPNTAPGIWLQYVTLAGAIYDWGGTTLRDDVKVYDIWGAPSWMRDTDFLSTTDDSFNRGAAGTYIRNSFPEPSQYER